MWTVYFSPTDYPRQYVCREFEIDDAGVRPTPRCVVAPTIEVVRRILPLGVVRLARSPDDHRSVVESWI